MNFFSLLVACLATFRLALLISSEQGPMRIFAKLRKLPPPKSNARDGLSCSWCASIWISAGITSFLCHRDHFDLVEWPIYWLAISAGSVVINQLTIAWLK
jgi:hypothetical protein